MERHSSRVPEDEPPPPPPVVGVPCNPLNLATQSGSNLSRMLRILTLSPAGPTSCMPPGPLTFLGDGHKGDLKPDAAGVPWNMLNLATLAGSNPSWTLRSSTLSEFGTEQLESIALSHVTGNRSFADKSEAVVSMLADKYPGQASRLARHAPCSVTCCFTLTPAQQLVSRFLSCS